MKEIRTVKMVEQTTVQFIADDGKVFNNEIDCKAYEKSKDKERCLADFLALNPIKLNDTAFIGIYTTEAPTYVLKLKSEKDKLALLCYTNNVYGYRVDNNFDYINTYPMTAIVHFEEGYAWVQQNLSEFVSDLNQVINAIQTVNGDDDNDN